MSFPKQATLTNYLLLLGAGLIWGSQYILTKIALGSFSTSMIAAGRVGIGAAILTLLLLPGKKNPEKESSAPFLKSLPDFILIGFLEATLPCLLVTWAQMHLASSVTAILIGTVPLFATLLEALFVKGSYISLKKTIGVTLGFIGIIVLVGPELTHPNPAELNHTSLLLPVLAVLASALFFATAMLLIQVRLGTRFGPIRSAQGILSGAAITTIPLMLWLTHPWTMSSFHASTSAILALLALGVFCGGVVYTLFVVLINRAGPSFASTCNYLVPPIGAFIGIAFSGEKLTPSLLCSLSLILISLWLSGSKNTKSEKATERLH